MPQERPGLARRICGQLVPSRSRLSRFSFSLPTGHSGDKLYTSHTRGKCFVRAGGPVPGPLVLVFYVQNVV